MPWLEKYSSQMTSALRKRSFGKIYLEIGINEMGTGTVDSFMEAYEAAVDHLRELQPDAILYVCGIMYVEQSKSELKAFVYLRILHDAVAGKILQPDDIIFAQEMHLVPGVVRVQVPGLVRHHLVDVQVTVEALSCPPRKLPAYPWNAQQTILPFPSGSGCFSAKWKSGFSPLQRAPPLLLSPRLQGSRWG